MITEKGTVKTSIVHDENVYKELNKGMHNLGILYIVCGAIIFVMGLAMSILSALDDTGSWEDITMIVVGAAFLALGIFFLLMCSRTAKTALKFKRVQELEFFSDYLLEKGYTDGEHTSTNKIYYKWIVKIKETQNYLFLYNTRMTAIAVDKNGLPLNELNTIRSLLGRAPQPAPAQNTQEGGTPPDPFTDNKE